MVLCVAGTLTPVRTVLAALDSPGSQPAAASVQADGQTQALLAEVEKQVMEGKVATGDKNALAIWQEVIARGVPPTPGTVVALTDFVTRLTSREEDAKSAGHASAVLDIQLFLSLANDLLKRSDATVPAVASRAEARPADNERSLHNLETSGTASATSPPTAIAPAAPIAAGPAPNTASVNLKALDGPAASVDHTAAGADPAAAPGVGRSAPVTTEIRPAVQMPSAREQTVPTSGPSEPQPPAKTEIASVATSVDGTTTPKADLTSTTLPTVAHNMPLASVAPKAPAPASASDKVAADVLIRRGDAMLAIKDISAARKLYEYAANAGSAEAAIALARTYDPAYLAKLEIIGVVADQSMAVVWYRKAAALGDHNAEAPLRMLARTAN